MLQFHFALLLECIFVEGVLEVFQAENTVLGDPGMEGTQVSILIWLHDKNYLGLLHLQILESRIIFSLPAQKLLAAQSLLQTGHVHTIAASARSLHITDFKIITFCLFNVIISQFRVTCNRIITEWVQAFTLPGMKKRVVLHHLKSATNWMKSNICFQQNTSQSLNQYLWIYLGSPALLRYFENQCHFNCTQLFSYSWSSFSMLRFLVIRLWCAATRSSCIENHWTQYKKLIK